MCFFMALCQRQYTALSPRDLWTPVVRTWSAGSTSLYGLKQAPRAWYSRFATFLLTLGFPEDRSDTSLFIYRRGDETAYLLLMSMTLCSPPPVSDCFRVSFPLCSRGLL